MKKLVVVIFGFLVIFSFGACNTSSATSEIPIVIPSTNTAFISPTSTVPFVPTVNPLTPTAIAQFFHTQEAITITPEPPYTPSYEDCSMGWNALGSWALCNSFEDPITIINKSNKAWEFSYKTYYGKEFWIHVHASYT